MARGRRTCMHLQRWRSSARSGTGEAWRLTRTRRPRRAAGAQPAGWLPTAAGQARPPIPAPLRRSRSQGAASQAPRQRPTRRHLPTQRRRSQRLSAQVLRPIGRTLAFCVYSGYYVACSSSQTAERRISDRSASLSTSSAAWYDSRAVARVYQAPNIFREQATRARGQRSHTRSWTATQQLDCLCNRVITTPSNTADERRVLYTSLGHKRPPVFRPLLRCDVARSGRAA